MRLKRLTLHGFKTFADKTVIEFAPGVTAIVGPNGSGKSNLLDALTWCLGEQKASSVRASRAQDVIFAGSARRKPLGMAEVSLTVDNEDRFLPLDFAEVTVTRRIYRSGEGEYLLNKAPCRLKDITELFLDTGVGRGAYAIVNQSEIDSILSARPEDRRELFEEAAGIKKYRQRKREAQRKLETTEQNLVRIADIAREVETGLGPLEAQALTARRYNELTEKLRAVEVGQLAWDYKRLADELAELHGQAEAATKESETLRAEADGLEASAQALGERIADAEAEMDRARLVQQTALAEGERAESRIALSRERRAGAARTLETLERDLKGLGDDADRFEQEANEQEQAALAAETRAADLSTRLNEAETRAREADRALTELTRLVRGQEADYLELARRLAGQKAELDAVRARMANRANDVSEVEKRVEARVHETEEARKEAEVLLGQAENARRILIEAERVLAEERQPARQKAQQELAAAGEKRTAREKRLAEQGARLRVLEETEAAQEGYFAGVRAVARAVQAGRLRGRFDLMADVLRVPPELDTAVEIALGASLQDMVCDTEAEAKAAIGFLNETRSGRATFLPLDALREVEVPDALRRAARQFSGVLGSGADLVGHDADVAPAVRVLLARVLFVDDLETATRVSRQIRDWAKIVTLSGEVVVPTGAITGGAQGRPGPNLLGRKREIGELRKAQTAGKTEIAALQTQEEQARLAADGARKAVHEAESAVQTARELARDAERKQQARHAEAERLAREADILRQRVQTLQESGMQDAVREQTLAAALENSGKQDEGAQATREEAQNRQATLALRRGEAQTEARAFSSELTLMRERTRTLARDAVRARDNARRADESAHERTLRADEARAVLAAEDAGEAARLADRDRARVHRENADVQFNKWRERRQALLGENFQLTERIKATRRTSERAGEQAQQNRVRAARVDVQRESVAERLLAEYELHPESALELTGGAAPTRDVAQEIARLRREIRALGIVNTGAIEEYDRLSERSRFLSEQRADLEAAKTKLSEAIRDIDESTRGVFQDTFHAVAQAFARQFSRLFGGGTTELILTTPDDIFETGIEIIAQPPGKKRQNLSLLSGGERALTATALLFAFLETKPAPFVVLDEVDAPLDGSNVEKYADLLRDFGQTGQFIVITHNATTMEAAPLWYGVTMQEPGVSRGLSLRVPDPTGADRETAEAVPD